MRGFICAALLLSLGCSSDPGEPTGNDHEALSAVPFCLPGEKRVCTLGPPPVCYCAPENPPVKTMEAR
jgi:hypothetical protein